MPRAATNPHNLDFSFRARIERATTQTRQFLVVAFHLGAISRPSAPGFIVEEQGLTKRIVANLQVEHDTCRPQASLRRGTNGKGWLFVSRETVHVPAMFCPECRAEYRPGFTHCTDCGVDLVPELLQRRADVNSGVPKKAWIPVERLQKNSLTKLAFTFILHQFIGMYGIPYTAPLVFSLGFKTLFLFGYSYPQRSFYSIVSERPYFPVQITLALILGWLLGRALHHRSMLWVWVLPLPILCYAVATARVLMPTSVLASVGQSRLSHYFGWGCRPREHCFDQLYDNHALLYFAGLCHRCSTGTENTRVRRASK